jgi:hypothetical protein
MTKIIDTASILFDALYDVFYSLLNDGQRTALDRVAADGPLPALNLLLGQVATLDALLIDDSVAAILAAARQHLTAWSPSALDERQPSQHRRAA